MSQGEEYILGTSLTEQKRLLKQGTLFEAEACWLLDRLGLTVGGRAIDLGCGPLGILHLLAERVGPTGEVVGVDREARLLDMAQTILAERRLPNVRVFQGDVTATGLPRASFDVVHERLVLMINPHTERVLAEMVALTRPGGVVAVQDLDVVSLVCEPPHPAWLQLLTTYQRVYQARGLDGYLGRRLPGLLRAAGLVEVQVKVHAQVSHAGEFGQMLFLEIVEGLRDHIIADGLHTPDELTALVEELRGHLNTPGTFVVQPLLFQVWGRKPV
ncbi:methyltransferase domain-containing protein [Scytonema sp. UIC 10036]|uniref:methyltransferase domain-containing protein n=1 Tax=Scytonema sp. UIC 10036 TaxID=2304196 RepID=UPI0012DA458E|nr:methyltransferase domain-containing protein [Scytonema sp. UIC 10036]MUG97877.1 methyltransferase domain-containing protein [Scytonema sp. UIC 10036]